MGLINWVSFYLNKNIGLKPDDKEKLLSNQGVRNLSRKEVIKISTLGNDKKITLILKVYASKSFNNKEEGSFTDEEKKRIIDILFRARGDKQFVYSCDLINNTSSLNKKNVIESVSLVALAKHDFQSEFSSYIALDSLMQRHDSFIRIVRILTLLDKDKAIDFHGYIKRVEETSKDTFEISRLISVQLEKYERLMSINTTIKSEKSEKGFESIQGLSFYERKRIETLTDPQKKAALISVYNDEKFIDKNSGITEEEKQLIINSIFNSKGDIQFCEACMTFCEIKTNNFLIVSGVTLSVIESIANSEKDFQAKYVGILARDTLIQKEQCYVDLIQCISEIDNEEELKSIFDFIQKLLDDVDEYSNYQVTKNLERLISTYHKDALIREKYFPKLPIAFTPKQIVNKPKIKVKTKQNISGRRLKTER